MKSWGWGGDSLTRRFPTHSPSVVYCHDQRRLRPPTVPDEHAIIAPSFSLHPAPGRPLGVIGTSVIGRILLFHPLGDRGPESGSRSCVRADPERQQPGPGSVVRCSAELSVVLKPDCFHPAFSHDQRPFLDPFLHFLRSL